MRKRRMREDGVCLSSTSTQEGKAKRKRRERQKEEKENDEKKCDCFFRAGGKKRSFSSAELVRERAKHLGIFLNEQENKREWEVLVLSFEKVRKGVVYDFIFASTTSPFILSRCRGLQKDTWVIRSDDVHTVGGGLHTLGSGVHTLDPGVHTLGCRVYSQLVRCTYTWLGCRYTMPLRWMAS